MGTTQHDVHTIQKYYDPVTKIIHMPKDEFHADPLGVGSYLFRSMKENVNKIAQVDSLTNESQNYGEFLKRSIRTSIELKAMGVKTGDVVMICSYNHINSSVPFVATHFIGAINTATDPSQSKEDIVYLLKLVTPKVVFVCTEAQHKMKESIIESQLHIDMVVFGETKYTSFDNFITPKVGEEYFEPHSVKDPDSIASIIFSSGTTGMPKGISLSNKFLLYHATGNMFPYCTGFASLYWISNTVSTIAMILTASRKVILRHFDPSTLWELIESHKIEKIFIAPSDFILLMHKKPKNLPTFIKVFAIGGSGISPDFLVQAQKSLPTTKIKFGYGLSELFAVFSAVANKPGSVGVPYKGKSYKVVDIDTGRNLGFNQRGELRVKTEWVTNGYYKQDSTSIWDEEGYLKTGDIVYYDEDFCFFVVDRIKEMFKYKSWHIVPAKIETIILKHPEIVLCAVVGIPHPEDDFHILAVVQLCKGSTLSPDKINDFVDGKLDDRHKLRAGVRIVDKFPLTPSAKIRRRDLVTMYMNGEI